MAHTSSCWFRSSLLATLGGEIVAVIVLSGAGTPVAVAGGMTLGDALVMWCAWSLAYAGTVIAVHHVLARHRDAASRQARRWSLLVCVVLGMLITIDAAAAFTVPLVGVALAVVIVSPRATRLRTIGFVFLAGSSVAAACAIAAADVSASHPRDELAAPG